MSYDFRENAQIEEELQKLPDKVADALYAWRKATIEKEKILAIKYLSYRGDGEKRTVSEIEALVNKDDVCYQAKLVEAVQESVYTRCLEKLYAAKRSASLRTAY